jgi:tetratricopeptide (TPR) repeat protein/SAM-dependent methyltransferase
MVVRAHFSDEPSAMNRKERRAANKRTQGGGTSPGAPAVAAMFDRAIQHHQAGQLAEAEALCRTILARDPRHIGSLHLLGVIAHQHGRFEEAIAQFRSVIGLRPDIAVVHQGLGGALAAAGRLEEAAAAFERALALKAGAPPSAEDVGSHLNLGNLYNQLGRPQDAARCYERVLSLEPKHAEAHNSLGAVLLGQGRHAEASERFARALTLAPELFEGFSNVSAALRRVNRTLDDTVRRAVAAWPRRLPADELFPPGALGEIAGDPMLRCVLQSSTVRDLDLEKFLTSARLVLLNWAADAAHDQDASALGLACGLARQCFVNEYVLLDTAEEAARVEALRQSIIEMLDAGVTVAPLRLATLACYVPLGSLPSPRRLLEQTWPEAPAGVLTQQVREVEADAALRDSIPRLTAIVDEASTRVRQQYEENPYPRWVLPPSAHAPLSVDDYLRARFPAAPFQPLGKRAALDILIAGCGTGEHPIGMARRFRGARVLAVDLSLSSLAYAMRKTRELDLHNIEYAQADIMQLGSLGRSFDIIDASGVLHHLSDPVAGWRELMRLLRPAGLMRIGLYSEQARADIVAARGFIAERGLQSSADDIRRCRHELLATPFAAVSKYRDFFSVSECRDLLFHVQERRFTIPQIKEVLNALKLRFIGFELDPATVKAYRERFPRDNAMTNLERWVEFETERSDVFRAMYQFWCQRP